MEKECKDEYQKVIIPPVSSVLRVSVDHIDIQIDGQPPARRKALPVEAARSPSREKQPRKEGVEGHQGHQPVVLPCIRGISWAPDTIERSACGRFHAQHEKMRTESCQWVMASNQNMRAWCWAGIRGHCNDNGTHRQEPAGWCTPDGCRAA